MWNELDEIARRELGSVAGVLRRLAKERLDMIAEARQPQFAVTAPDIPAYLQMHSDVLPDMEAAKTIDDARAIYYTLLAFHRRTWQERSGVRVMGLPTSPEAQTFATLNENLQHLSTDEQRNRFARWLHEIHSQR
jgi:hypothetical protein